MKAGRRRPDPWRTAFFGVLILAILGGAAWALLGSSLLVVRHEEVSGNRLVPTAEIIEAAGIRHGTSLTSVNAAAAEHRIEQIRQVLSATVSRSWPDTIVISVRERTPVLALAEAGRYALVDSHGVTVEWVRRKPAGMPLIRSPQAAAPDGQGVAAAAAVLQQLPATLRAMIVSVSAPGADAVKFALRGGITVVWGSAGQTQAKVEELTVLLRTKARYYDVSDPATAVTQGQPG